MPSVIEKVEEAVVTSPEKLFFQVFLGFKKPRGIATVFVGDGTDGCGVYAILAEIFQRSAWEISQVMAELAWNGGDGFMQEYLSLGDASQAVGKASLFAHRTGCVCFRLQQAYFHIKETRK